MAMCRSRAVGVAPLRRVEVVFFDMPHFIVGRPGRAASFQGELAQWVSENEKENKSENGMGMRGGVGGCGAVSCRLLIHLGLSKGVSMEQYFGLVIVQPGSTWSDFSESESTA